MSRALYGENVPHETVSHAEFFLRKFYKVENQAKNDENEHYFIEYSDIRNFDGNI